MLQYSQDCDCNIYVLIDKSVSEKDKKLLENTAKLFNSEIQFIEVGNEMDNCYTVRDISKATYYRLLIPWLVPEKTVVYCDGDIIFTRSIRTLYEHSINDKLIAAVHTPYYDSPDFRSYSSKLKLNALEYVNAGIMLMNCAQMRRENLKEQFMAHTGNQYCYQDQDIINIVCKGRILYLPLEFNYPSYLFRATEKKPAIIHFSGPKPWKGFTNLWAYWWSIYEKTLVYDADFEEAMYKRILIPDYSIKKIVLLFMRHLKNKLKLI